MALAPRVRDEMAKIFHPAAGSSGRATPESAPGRVAPPCRHRDAAQGSAAGRETKTSTRDLDDRLARSVILGHNMAQPPQVPPPRRATVATSLPGSSGRIQRVLSPERFIAIHESIFKEADALLRGQGDLRQTMIDLAQERATTAEIDEFLEDREQDPEKADPEIGHFMLEKKAHSIAKFVSELPPETSGEEIAVYTAIAEAFQDVLAGQTVDLEAHYTALDQLKIHEGLAYTMLEDIQKAQRVEATRAAQQTKSTGGEIDVGGIPPDLAVATTTKGGPAELEEKVKIGLGGFFIDPKKPGEVDGQPFAAVESGSLHASGEDGFVASVVTSVRPGDKKPVEIAEQYRNEAFAVTSKDQQQAHEADSKFALVVGVNAKADLRDTATGQVGGIVDTVAGWPQERFPLRAVGFLWHQWRHDKQAARTEDVKAAYDLLGSGSEGGLTKQEVEEYEAEVRGDFPHGAARSLVFRETTPLADAMGKQFRDVWVHISDPDSPSLQSRTGQRDQDQQEILVPVFDVYGRIIGEQRAGHQEGTLPPMIISGGYEFRRDEPEAGVAGDVKNDEALALIGNRLDLTIRNTIASSGPGAAKNIYLPEPNLLFKYDPLLKGKTKNLPLFGPNKREAIELVSHYTSWLKKKNPAVLFDVRANVATETAERFRIDRKREESASPLTISGFDPSRLTAKDLELIVGQSQSYASYNTWVLPMKPNLGASGEILKTAFNACMITEALHFDPKAIRESLDTFEVPSVKTLVAMFEGAKLKHAGRAQDKEGIYAEVAAQLHSVGNALKAFLGALLSGTIHDPIAEKQSQ